MKSVSAGEAWTGVADCRNCAIRQSALFAGLDADDFDAIHRPIGQISYDAGREIYAQEDPAAAIFTIRSGLVKLTQYLPDGTQRIVRLLRSTDVVGLEALLCERYEHSAVALHRTQICRIPRTIVRDLVVRKPQLFGEIMSRWHRALMDSDRVITELNTGPARARVVRLLLWLAEHGDGRHCELFGREDIGALLGLTTETVSRIIADMKRRGVLSPSRPGEILCDVGALRGELAAA